jgi:hypothetical protein
MVTVMTKVLGTAHHLDGSPASEMLFFLINFRQWAMSKISVKTKSTSTVHSNPVQYT